MGKAALQLGLSLIMAAVLSACEVQGDGPASGRTSAAAAGFSAERLQRLDDTFQRLIADKTYPGLVTMMSRHGKIVHQGTYGAQNIEAGVDVQPDTIFYMGSQTKPVTGIAMMILYEEGKWRPEEPIAKYIPEFAELRVFTGVNEDGSLATEVPHHQPTMGELMTMTAGFTYALQAEANPIDRLYRDRRVLQSETLQEMIEKIADIPLLYQPGTRWVYGVSADIQGYLIEKFSGQSYQDFVRERIFEPLGMTDSSFRVPKEKLPRLSKIYIYNAEKDALAAVQMPGEEGVPPNIVSGGGGLYTTAPDFLRFTQMLVNGGELDGVRVLSPSTVQIMASNHLDENLLANGKFGLPSLPNGMVFPNNIDNTDAFGLAFYRLQPGLGYGYNMGVFHDPMKLASPVGAGTFAWGGAFGTWFWADPVNDVVFVGMGQRGDLFVLPDMGGITRTLTLQALVDPAK